jgi:2-polyprenyl-6-methoxyphenol hydroxylase-like FAD-dependent oxidoreductase
VAERIGIIDAIKEVRYPLDYMEYVDKAGKPYMSVEMNRIKWAFENKYLPMQRSDLERILFEKAKSEGLGVRFDTQVRSVNDMDSTVEVEFEDNSQDNFSLVFGADGVHSKIRRLVFGREEEFSRFLGASVAAFHTTNKYGLKSAIRLFEERDHMVAVYPISSQEITTIYLFRNRDSGYVPKEKRLALLRDTFKGSGWISERILNDLEPSTSIFLDTFTQILMKSWTKGRIALLGDACGCLTMISGQGSQVAMGEAFVIASELERNGTAFTQALGAYEKFFLPLVRKKQDNAARLLKIVLPSAYLPGWLRRLAISMLFESPILKLMPLYFGSKSALINR